MTIESVVQLKSYGPDGKRKTREQERVTLKNTKHQKPNNKLLNPLQK
jgi:hypothetical protein